MIIKKKIFNSVYTGLIPGLVVPVIVLLLFWLIKYPEYNLPGFFKIIFGLKILTHIISLCAIPNILLFFIFIWRNFLIPARGVLLATFIIAAIVLIIRFI